MFSLQFCGSDDEPSTKNSLVKTDVGTVEGTVSTATIGASGGTLESADGNLAITFPENALTTDTEITIQPISNNAPLGLGSAYRLEPEGTIFSVPVTLTFKFTDETLNGIPAEFLWIVTQNGDGSWSAALNSEADATAKTVTVTTTHFSDWAIGKFIDLSLDPTSRTVKKGEYVNFEIVGFTNRAADEDELAPLYKPSVIDDGLVDLVPFYLKNNKFRVKQWTLNGTTAPVSNSNGSLTAKDKEATYKAPNSIPNPNPIAVTVELERERDGSILDNYLLTSSVRVMEDGYYILLEVDGQQYEYIQYGFNGEGPENESDFWIANCALTDGGVLELGGSHISGINGDHFFALQVAHPEGGGIVLKCINDGGDDAVNYSPAQDGNAYQLQYTVRQWQNDFCDIEYKCSQFGVNLIEYLGEDEVVVGEFTGKVYLDTDEMEDNCESSAEKNVRGSFRLFVVNG